ncbi:MAG: hypothetical protein AAB922_03050 [Patescibacteria group bacterium]
MKLLKSRTFWTLVFMLVFNVFAAVEGNLNPMFVSIVDAILTTLAAYFKLNPSQKYEQEN